MKRPLSTRTIIKELECEIGSYQSGYEECDGVIRDKGALKTMAALEDAIAIVRQYKPKKLSGEQS